MTAATEALSNFLESYWAATHPPLISSKAERLLGSTKTQFNYMDIDSDKPLVPMTPGHPGLSVVTKVSINANYLFVNIHLKNLE